MARLHDMDGFTDKYFLRTREILRKEGINPYVRMQVFLRGPGKAHGIGDALEILDGFSSLRGNGGHLHAVREGEATGPDETVLLIEGYIQDFVTLETLYLGVLSERSVDLDRAYRNAKAIVAAAEDAPVFYFGARHFPWWLDEGIAEVCFRAGMRGCSTDRGARHWGAEGVGTIPHVLILAFASERPGNPTVGAARAFDRHVAPSVPRTILIDTFNREVDDTLAAAGALGGHLSGVRIDTCGENVAQGAGRVRLPDLDVPDRYLSGGGVTVPAVWALRRAMDENGCADRAVFVSSGFDAEKTAAFMKARRAYADLYGHALFGGIGTGSLLPGGRMATADLVQVRKDGRWVDHAKTGRRYRPNPRLKQMW